MELQALVLEAAGAATAQELAQSLAIGLAGPSAVLVRVWLVTSDHLHLAGSTGSPAGGGSYTRLDGSFSRIAMGQGKIGEIAASRSSQIVPSLRGDEDWLANPNWIARQGVRAFVGHPLLAGDDVFGVMAVFDRSRPTTEDLEQLAFVARYAGLRLADLRERTDLRAQLAGTLPVQSQAPTASSEAILTRSELRRLEKMTLEAALARTRGRVFGPRGAAALLGMKPTTLASRIKALGVAPVR